MKKIGKRLFFHFSFIDENTNKEEDFRFEYLDITQVEQDGKLLDDYQDIIDSLNLESTYGIHDFDGGGHESGWEDDGYTTYEVDQSKWLELVMIWHDELAKRGYTLGPIMNLKQFKKQTGLKL